MTEPETHPLLARILRYVPLFIWVVAVALVLLIPLKIIGYGYIPLDDANRHAAKIISGKDWSDILVLRDGVIHDHNAGWHFILGLFHEALSLDTDGLVALSVASLFLLFLASLLPWLRRPESLLIGASLCFVAAGGDMQRLALGRPYVFAMAVLILVLGLWTRKAAGRPGVPLSVGTILLFALAAFIHGSWYLFVLPIGAFFLCGRYADSIYLGLCFAVGVFVGACFTGAPIDYLVGHVGVVLSCFDASVPQPMLVGEFQPGNGEPQFMLLVLGLLVWKLSRGDRLADILRDPIFLLGVIGWVLGLKVVRFWTDWGFPSFLFWIVLQIDNELQDRLSLEAIPRVVATCMAAAALWFVTTSDRGSRWTSNLRVEFLEQDNPALAGWLPEDGGILYSHRMTVFYRTFYKNPTANWRYILGFEATFMPEEDHQTYRNIQWNRADPRTFEPWIAKMTPADRLVYPAAAGAQPNIPELEWFYACTDTWIGRLPREAGPAPRESDR